MGGIYVIGLSDATLQALTAALLGVVKTGVVSALTSPSPTALGVKVTSLSPLYLCFVCRVAGESDLPPIWEAVAQGQGKTEGLATLNQSLIRGLPSCRRVSRGRSNFSASLTMLALVKTCPS